jgi:membrane protease subunit (stomatin/prohibitin family)
MDKEVLVTKGRKRVSGRSSNKRGNDNIISNGSSIAVADGQCMIIVEQGQIVEVCAEPGEFTYDTSTEPSIFSGNLGSSIADTFKTFGKRFSYGGDTGKDQRVYYFNTKELIDNKFGTPNPVPFRIVDSKIGLDVDVSVRCSGVYSYRISDPIVFYTKVCGNVAESYTRDQLDSQLKTEFISALQPAFAKLSDLELRPNQIVAHNTDLEKAMNEALSVKWGELRGLEVVSIALGSVTLPPEDAEMVKQLQRTAVLQNANMAGAALVGAQADAMKAAAANPSGAMAGFMGMNMAMNAGGMNAQNLYAMGQQAQQQAQKPAQASAQESWKCVCGATVTGKFCPECGAKKPQPVQTETWKCQCGAVNTGKFCQECGLPKPSDSGEWTCPQCGRVNQGKFCQNCGTRKPG